MKVFIKKFIPEIVVGIIASISGACMVWYIFSSNLVTILSDQAAHLVFARLLTDSMTPGITQLGAWPPLLHVILFPTAAIDLLFITGLAGAVTLLPIFVAGSVVLYRLVYELTKDKMLSFTATLAYILNPYVLYHAVTPMMDTLFITMVIATAYFLILWLEHNRLHYLLWAGVFITLASLSRYEGLLLIPIAGFIIIAHFVSRREHYYKIEATLILFGTVAALGVAYLVVYNWVFVGHPLSFIGFGSGGGWFIGGDPILSLTRGDMAVSLTYLLHGSYYMIGKPLVFLSLGSIFIILIFIIFSRERLKIISTLALLFIPFMAVLYTFYRGTNSLHVPELPPFEHFFNTRYGLTWIAFAVVSPVILASFFKKIRWYVVSSLIVTCVLIASFIHLYTVVMVEDFFVIKDDITSNPIRKTANFSEALRVRSAFIKAFQADYDFGKILAIRYNNDFIFIDSSIPLKNYIYEGNYKYYDQVLDRPWLFVRWVIMQSPGSSASSFARDPIKNKWSNNAEFLQYYSIVEDDGDRQVYKHNEQAVLQYVKAYNFDPKKVPSLNSSIRNWDPDTIWEDMQLNQSRKTDTYNNI